MKHVPTKSKVQTPTILIKVVVTCADVGDISCGEQVSSYAVCVPQLLTSVRAPESVPRQQSAHHV